MHNAVLDYIKGASKRFAHQWVGPVLEVGSFDMNGSVRQFFKGEDYIGVDVRPGKGVDVVCPAREAPAIPGGYSVVISTEMLEHDPDWPESVGRMVRVIADGGLLIITAAAPGRAPHGLDFSPHYGNISPSALRAALEGAAKASGRSLSVVDVRLAPGRPMDVQATAVVEGPCTT